MFEWYWVFVFIAVWFHLSVMSVSLFLHRYIGHRYYEMHKSLQFVFRFILWANERLSPGWVESYVTKHMKHHAYSDTEKDPQSPHHKTLTEMCQPFVYDYSDVKKYAPHAKTPDDWMQIYMHEKYQKFGSVFLYVLCFVLFGFLGFSIFFLWRKLTHRWIGVFFGDWIVHKFGFTYAGNKGSDKSVILFPIGILLSGEDLHANHHNRPQDVKFSQRWFEFDLGWAYINIFEKLGLITFRNKQ